jgi:RimJ/RimL family protein N-acetyltransferase
MSAFVTLSGDRVCLRPWRDEDEEPFAAMNSDARVMEFFRDCLSRAQSDAMVDHTGSISRNTGLVCGRSRFRV